MAANLVSAGDSFHEGDYLGAGLSVLGEIPALGELATGAKIARAANKLRKAEKAASEGRTFITYVIKNEKKEVVYVGRASGVGTPERVLDRRFGNHRYKNAGVRSIVGIHQSKEASQGAEWVLYHSHQTEAVRNGRRLLNDEVPLRRNPEKWDYIRAYANER